MKKMKTNNKKNRFLLNKYRNWLVKREKEKYLEEEDAEAEQKESAAAEDAVAGETLTAPVF